MQTTSFAFTPTLDVPAFAPTVFITPTATAPTRTAVQPGPCLREAIGQCVESKTRAGYRDCYIRSLKRYLKQFSRGREDMPIGDVTLQVVADWFRERNEKLITEKSNRGRLAALFDFSCRKGWMASNPVKFLEKIRVNAKVPAIFDIEKCRKALAWTRARRPRYLAWFTLALFCGVRPDEISRLTWDCIDLERGIVTIDGAASKVRCRRNITMMPVAIDWLRLARMSYNSDLPVPHVSKRRYLRGLRDYLNLDRWPQDICRHTAASMWLAAVGDAGKVARQLGNSPSILLRHYTELVSQETAAAFWALTPQAV